jgi:hypothetical protein
MARVVSLKFHGGASEDSSLFTEMCGHLKIVTDVSEEISTLNFRFVHSG